MPWKSNRIFINSCSEKSMEPADAWIDETLRDPGHSGLSYCSGSRWCQTLFQFPKNWSRISALRHAYIKADAGNILSACRIMDAVVSAAFWWNAQTLSWNRKMSVQSICEIGRSNWKWERTLISLYAHWPENWLWPSGMRWMVGFQISSIMKQLSNGKLDPSLMSSSWSLLEPSDTTPEKSSLTAFHRQF